MGFRRGVGGICRLSPCTREWDLNERQFMKDQPIDDVEMPAEIDFRERIRGLHYISSGAKVLMLTTSRTPATVTDLVLAATRVKDPPA